jgi:hypothetical protein
MCGVIKWLWGNWRFFGDARVVGDNCGFCGILTRLCSLNFEFLKVLNDFSEILSKFEFEATVFTRIIAAAIWWLSTDLLFSPSNWYKILSDPLCLSLEIHQMTAAVIRGKTVAQVAGTRNFWEVLKVQNIKKPRETLKISRLTLMNSHSLRFSNIVCMKFEIFSDCWNSWYQKTV